MKQKIVLLGVLLLSGLGWYAYDQNSGTVSTTLNSYQSDGMELIKNPVQHTTVSPVIEKDGVDKKTELTSQGLVEDSAIVVIEKVELDRVNSIELPHIRVPKSNMSLPDLNKLITQNNMPALLEPGSATTVISGAQSSTNAENRQLKVDNKVLQSLEQQTGIPVHELEQAFLQESE